MTLKFKEKKDLEKLVLKEFERGLKEIEIEYGAEISAAFLRNIISTIEDIPVEVDTDKKCTCSLETRKTVIVNYDVMWHEGQIICQICNGFVGFFDAG